MSVQTAAPGLYFLGICMAVASGAVTALSMVVQSFALKYPAQRIPLSFCGRQLGEVDKNWVWGGGLVMYGVGTGVLYSFAGLWIPLSLLSCLFLTMLVFNLYFSHYLLGEVLTAPKVTGSIVVLAGACLCAIGTSVLDPGVPTRYSSDDVAALYAATGGAVYFGVLVTVVITTLVWMLLFERAYPYASKATNPAPDWQESLMAFVYPASLGLDETIAHLTLRCMNAMLTQCSTGGCTNPVFPVTIVMWIVTSLATVIWLRYVYKRYSVTTALPVEYGAASAADVVSGLVFFQEYKFYAPWRYPLIIGGVALCLLGIQIGRMQFRGFSRGRGRKSRGSAVVAVVVVDALQEGGVRDATEGSAALRAGTSTGKLAQIGAALPLPGAQLGHQDSSVSASESASASADASSAQAASAAAAEREAAEPQRQGVRTVEVQPARQLEDGPAESGESNRANQSGGASMAASFKASGGGTQRLPPLGGGEEGTEPRSTTTS